MREGLDFRRVFESTPGSRLVLSLELRVLAVSDDYLAATGTTREGLMDHNWLEIVASGDSSEQDRLRSVLHRLLATGEAQRLLVRSQVAGRHTQGLWRSRNTAVLDDSGKVCAVVHALDEAGEAARDDAQPAARREDGYAQLLNALPDPVVVFGADNLIRYVNAKTLEIFGFEASALIGHPMNVLIPERLHARQAETLDAFLAAPKPSRVAAGEQLYGSRVDGGEVPVEVNFSPLEAEGELLIVAVARDVTEKRRTEEAHHALAERLTNAVAGMREAFALYDATGTLALCNEAYVRFVGEARPGATRLSLRRRLLARATDPGDADLQAALLLDERAPAQTVELTTVDGSRLRLMSQPTGDGGATEVLWDLTDEARRTEQLRLARQEAEAASAAKSEFMSSMSHELRTPMNAILGFAQLTLKDKRIELHPRHREWIELVLQGGEHLLRLIDDLLEFSRIESGNVTLNMSTVEPAMILAAVTKTLLPLAVPVGVSLRITSPGGERLHVEADALRLKQVLLNLGSNAVKYNRQGGSVTFGMARTADGMLRISVSDTGLGIPVDKQAHLFEPFQRAGQEQGSIQGTGIGLAISRRLAHAMNGRVGFTSQPGVGSEFWIELRLVPNATRLQSTHPMLLETTPLQQHAAKKVLYVEDNVANVAFMRGVFETLCDVQLLVASSGELGVQAALAARPDLILMDLNLPGMSGGQALRLLREQEATRRIPVMALTASASTESREAGLRLGFDAYLTKPLDLNHFLDTVDQLLTRSTEHAAG